MNCLTSVKALQQHFVSVTIVKKKLYFFESVFVKRSLFKVYNYCLLKNSLSFQLSFFRWCNQARRGRTASTVRLNRTLLTQYLWAEAVHTCCLQDLKVTEEAPRSFLLGCPQERVTRTACLRLQPGVSSTEAETWTPWRHSSWRRSWRWKWWLTCTTGKAKTS